MKQPQKMQAMTRLFSPAVLALALLGWGSAALATSNLIPGIDIIVRKKPCGTPCVTSMKAPARADGVYQFNGLAPGDYEICVSGQSCKPVKVGPSGTLRGQTLSIDPPKDAGANGAPGKANQPIITKDVDNLTTQAFRGNRPLLDEPASTTVKLSQPPPNQLREKETAGAASTGVGDKSFPTVGAVYGSILPGISAQAAGSQLLGQGADALKGITLPNPSGGDKTPPGIVTPIAGTDVGLEHDPGGVKFSTKTGADGAFNFTKLPAGKYKLKLAGLPDQSLTVGADGIVGGKVMRGSDGGTANVQIFLNTNVTSKAPRPGGGDEKPGNWVGTVFSGATSDMVAARTAPPPKGGDKDLPSTVGTPIVGVPIGLEGDPGSIKVSAKTDKTGAFHFDKLPAGKYKLKLAGLPDQSLIVGSEGKVGGNLMKGSDGEMMIFDRWGNLIATPITVEHENFKVTNDREKMSIAAPNNGVDTTPQNKYADDFKQLNTKLDARTAKSTNGGDGELPGKKHNYKGVVTLVRGTVPNPDSGKEAGGDGQNKVWQLMQGQTGAVTADPSSGEGDDLPGKKHDSVGSVTLVKGTAPSPDSGGVKPGISEESNSTMMDVSTTRGRVGKPPVDPAGPAANHRVPQYELPSNIPGVAAEVGKPPAGPAGISVQGTTGVIISYGAATPKNTADQTAIKWTNNSGDIPPSTVTPIQGTPVGLEGDPGSIRVSTKTDGKGAFDFSNLPEGKYKLKLPGLPDQSVIVGPDGIVGGKLMRGSDGSMSIFDRWGK